MSTEAIIGSLVFTASALIAAILLPGIGWVIVGLPVYLVNSFIAVRFYEDFIKKEPEYKTATEFKPLPPEVPMTPIFDLEEIHKAQRAIDRAEKKKRKTAK